MVVIDALDPYVSFKNITIERKLRASTVEPVVVYLERLYTPIYLILITLFRSKTMFWELAISCRIFPHSV
jgi:hypothetical protein